MRKRVGSEYTKTASLIKSNHCAWSCHNHDVLQRSLGLSTGLGRRLACSDLGAGICRGWTNVEGSLSGGLICCLRRDILQATWVQVAGEGDMDRHVRTVCLISLNLSVVFRHWQGAHSQEVVVSGRPRGCVWGRLPWTALC